MRVNGGEKKPGNVVITSRMHTGAVLLCHCADARRKGRLLNLQHGQKDRQSLGQLLEKLSERCWVSSACVCAQSGQGACLWTTTHSKAFFGTGETTEGRDGEERNVEGLGQRSELPSQR